MRRTSSHGLRFRCRYVEDIKRKSSSYVDKEFVLWQSIHAMEHRSEKVGKTLSIEDGA